MDLGFLYNLLDKENIYSFIAGVVVGYGIGAVILSGKKPKIDKEQRGCFSVYDKKGHISILVFYKNGKLKNIGCPYRQKRFLRAPYCKALGHKCKELF